MGMLSSFWRKESDEDVQSRAGPLPLNWLCSWAPCPPGPGARKLSWGLAALEVPLPPLALSRLCWQPEGVCSMQKFHWGLNKRPIVPGGEKGGNQGDLPLRAAA